MLCTKCEYKNSKIQEGSHNCPICDEPMIELLMPKEDFKNLRTLLANGGSEVTPNELMLLWHEVCQEMENRDKAEE